jgi:2-desacetyl-2-hydroxyethyl bacteriochlorophyllide A dehydrogenase
MKALAYIEPGHVELQDRALPEFGPDDLLVKVRAASICGTDLRIWRNGHFKIPPGTARVLGHEIAGDVVEAGSCVEGFAVGDRVTVTPNVGCGRCLMCREGYNNMCPDYEAFGISFDGGFQEYMVVPGIAMERGNVFHIPDAVSYKAAALCEPLSCCHWGQMPLHIQPHDELLVVGAGPIGLFHVMLGKVRGARRVLVANRRQNRLDFAGRVGADVLLNVAEESLYDAVMRVTDGRGVDVIVTAASDAEVQSTAVRMLATHGRVNFFSGLGKAVDVPVDTNRVHYKGLILTGTTGSTNSSYEEAVQLVADGRIDVEQMITRTFAISDAVDAIEFAASGAGMKTVIDFDL